MRMTGANRIAAVLFAFVCMSASSLSCADTTIVIVRHGEKPGRGLGQLSCQGLNRALKLPDVLLSKYGNPVGIYAPNPAIGKVDEGVSYAYIRPLATIEPLAIRAGLPVNLNWGMRDISPLAGQLMAQTDGTFVVAWEHHYGEKLARRLMSGYGENPAAIPEWDNADFDSIYVIRVTGSGHGARHAIFSREQENLNALPTDCAN